MCEGKLSTSFRRNVLVRSVAAVLLVFVTGSSSVFAFPNLNDLKKAVKDVEKVEKGIKKIKEEVEDTKKSSETRKKNAQEKAEKDKIKNRIKSLPKVSTEFRAAVLDDNDAEVKRMIAAGESPDCVFNGETMLGSAAKHGSAKVVKVLLDAGVDPNEPCDQYGHIPLTRPMHTEISASSAVAVVEHLIAAGANVNATDFNREESVLMEACRNAPPEVVQVLIDNGADVNYETSDSETPLSAAITYNGGAGASYLSKAKILVKAGADVNATGVELPVQNSVLNAVTKFLISSGADVNKVLRANKSNYPIEATKSENLEALKILVKAKANMDARDKWNENALHKIGGAEYGNTTSYAGNARYNSITEITKFLAKSDVDLEARNNDDESPLDVAARWGCGGVCEALIKAGAKVNARNGNGKTALWYAENVRSDRDISGSNKILKKYGATY